MMATPLSLRACSRSNRRSTSRPEITAVNHVRTIHTAPDAVFVAISADFVDGLTMGEGEHAIEDMERELKAISPLITSIYIRPERAQDAIRAA